MTTKYLVPCSCGQRVAVEVRRAGTTVTCPCGSPVDVPGLSQLRALEAVEVGGDRPAGRAAWTPRQGVLFVAGLGLAGVCLAILAGSAYRWSQLDTRTEPIDTSPWREEVRTLDIEDQWELWSRLSDLDRFPLDRQQLPRYVIHQRQAAAMQAWMVIAAGGVLAGAALAGSALLVGRKPRHRP